MSSSISYMDSQVCLNFEDPNIYHDHVLIIEEKKFYVVAGTLSMWSEHFRGMFSGHFNESDKHEIELKDVDPLEFESFLRLIYQHDVSTIKVSNVLSLIELSHRFLAPVIFQLCKKYANDHFHSFHDKTLDGLGIACIYGMEELKTKLIDLLKTDYYMVVLGITNVLEAAYEHKLIDLQNHVSLFMIDQTHPRTCSDHLDCCEKLGLPKLKASIIEEIEQWEWSYVTPNYILELTEAAFKHNITVLKASKCYYKDTGAAELVKFILKRKWKSLDLSEMKMPVLPREILLNVSESFMLNRCYTNGEYADLTNFDDALLDSWFSPDKTLKLGVSVTGFTVEGVVKQLKKLCESKKVLEEYRFGIIQGDPEEINDILNKFKDIRWKRLGVWNNVHTFEVSSIHGQQCSVNIKVFDNCTNL